MKPASPQPARLPATPGDRALFWRQPGFLILTVVVAYLLIGLLIVTRYGESIDEPPRIEYANHSLDAIRGVQFSLQDEKGPFYGMLALLMAKALPVLIRGWGFIDAWHYMNFVAFVLGVFFFYRLCRRLVEPPVALAAALLFSTQPILWGHSFINPKDIPFMAFFLGSVCLGLEMVDHWAAQSLIPGEKLTLRGELAVLRRRLPGEWASASRRLRRLLTGLLLLLGALGLSYPLFLALIARIVRQAYAAPAASPLGRLFQRVAERAGQVSVEAYIGKAQTLYSWAVILIAIFLALALVWTVLRIYPTLRWTAVQPRLLLAACFLGFASDIRTLGPASGMLVAVYFLAKAGRRAVPYLLEYGAAALVVIYVFWPNLWRNPLGGYLASVSVAADFPWVGNIIFAGVKYTHGEHPLFYLPAVFTLQFTETAVVLILAGILLACIYLVRKAALRWDMLLAGAWFAAPVAASIVLHSTVYNNFRQFLFVVPPLFLFAGLALQVIWERLKRRVLIFSSLVALILLPGLYWDWQLHPYQYVYYNALAGGVAEASHYYDMDYWLTTYKEGIEYINQVAPPNSMVYVWISKNTATQYLRPDLILTADPDPKNFAGVQTFYAVIPTHFVGSGAYFPKSKVIYEVWRAGALLAQVKQVEKGDILQEN
jgi:hypothetical protein